MQSYQAEPDSQHLDSKRLNMFRSPLYGGGADGIKVLVFREIAVRIISPGLDILFVKSALEIVESTTGLFIAAPPGRAVPENAQK